MVLINIGGDPNDAHYRYKRQKIEVTHVQRCGGSMRITNMREISRALNPRGQEEAFIKYFYTRLKKTCGMKVSSDGMFKGDVAVDRLEVALEEVITEKFLCPQCYCPELSKNKNGRFCKACGWSQCAGEDVQVTQITSTTIIRSERITVRENGAPPETPAMARACKIARKLYAASVKLPRGSKQRRDMERALDVFWTIDSSLSARDTVVAENEVMHDKWAVRSAALVDEEEVLDAEHIGAVESILGEIHREIESNQIAAH